MGNDAAPGARQELWRRYDAGDLDAAELDARLVAVDRAGDDPAALALALDGPIRRRRALTRPPLVVAAVVAVAAVAAVVVGAAIAVRSDDGGATSAVAVPAPLPPPIPGGPPTPECRAADDALDALDDTDAAVGADDPAATDALLSDPPALPEGYSVAEEDSITPGTDPNVALAVYAGTPPPVEILGRDLAGPLLVTIRAFRYESVAAAAEAARAVVRTGACGGYDPEPFTVPDRPELNGAVVEGIIPATAFSGFRVGDRRIVVAVPAGADDDAAVEAARQLAGTLAGLELDAARTPPAPR